MIDLQLIISSLPSLLEGVLKTLQITGCSLFIGFVFGTLLGIAQSKGPYALRTLILLYTTIIRGTPMLIQIIFFNVATPLSLFWAATIAIGVNSSAYICNIIRAGINAVGTGQIEASKALGLTPYQTIRYIILPQAFRTVLPSLANEAVTLTKDSSLASTIGVMELTMTGRIMASETYDVISTYAIVAVLYLILTTILSVIFIKIEQRIQYAQN